MSDNRASHKCRGYRVAESFDTTRESGWIDHSLIKDDPRIKQIDVSVDAFDRYEASRANTMELVQTADEYIGTIERRLSAIGRGGGSLALLYNSGMDPDERCGIGGMTESFLRERERLVFEWFSSRTIPIAFVLAGGYNGAALSREQLVALHRMTITSGISASPTAALHRRDPEAALPRVCSQSDAVG